MTRGRVGVVEGVGELSCSTPRRLSSSRRRRRSAASSGKPPREHGKGVPIQMPSQSMRHRCSLKSFSCPSNGACPTYPPPPAKGGGERGGGNQKRDQPKGKGTGPGCPAGPNGLVSVPARGRGLRGPGKPTTPGATPP